MSMTYPTTTEDTLRPYGDTVRPRAETRPEGMTRDDDVFVPRYARARKKTGVRTWMILAPIGALALAAGAVVVLSASPTETQPLVEPEPALAPLTATPTAVDPAAVVPPATPVAAAPVEAPPAPPPAVQRRVTPAPAARSAAIAPRAAAPRPAPAAAVAAEPTGPRPYAAATSGTATAAPTVTASAPAATTPPPVVIVEPAT